MKNFIIKILHYIYFYVIRFIKHPPITYYNKPNLKYGVIQKESIPKIIWIFWFDPIQPELIHLCINNIKHKNPQYEVKVLNKKNIENYINIDIEKLIKIMPMANLSDLIRLKLLKRYGGIWADASIIINQSFDEFFTLDDLKYDFIGYYNAYQSGASTIPVIESWLIAAPPNSVFISEWLHYFSSIEQYGSKRYFEKIKLNPNYNEISKGLSNPEYLVVYLAARLAFIKTNNKNIFLHPCDNSAYLMQINAKWRTRRTVANLYLRNAERTLPICKLTNGDRKYYKFLKEQKLIHTNSLIGKFLNEVHNDD